MFQNGHVGKALHELLQNDFTFKVDKLILYSSPIFVRNLFLAVGVFGGKGNKAVEET